MPGGKGARISPTTARLLWRHHRFSVPPLTTILSSDAIVVNDLMQQIEICAMAWLQAGDSTYV